MATTLAEPAVDDVTAKFERLLGEYYAARRSDWGPRLALAHAETDKFGGSWDSEDRSRFFSEACARLDVNGAGDRMQAIEEEMKPLARSIVASPTKSTEALRAKALVAFWQVAPLCAGDTEYYFDNETHFQLLFSAVAEFCGITRKIAATGFTLPEMPDLFSPFDDEEEA